MQTRTALPGDKRKRHARDRCYHLEKFASLWPGKVAVRRQVLPRCGRVRMEQPSDRGFRARMIGMEYFLQQLINGLTLGSIYGLIAIGYTMVYGIIGMINFAHGDIFMIGAFLALIAFLVLVALGVTAVPLALFIVLLVAMALTSLY